MPGNDAIFLAIDSPTALAQIGGIAILDPSEADDFGFERFREVLGERISGAPRFQSRVREVPLGLGLPYWIDDVDFDLDSHIHRIALPSPGGMRELADLAGHLFARPLDRRLPLWQLWFIEGLEGGRVATFQLNHHCMIDGGSGRGLIDMLYDTEPDPPPRAHVPRRPQPLLTGEPSDLELLVRGAGSSLLTPFRVARYATQALRRGRVLLQASREQDAPALENVPRLPFNATIGPRRGFACSSISLKSVRDIKKHFGVKVNDVVLALSSGALRRYLKAQGELPADSLAASVPVSTRDEEDKEFTNRIANMVVTLATDVEDPVERLLAIANASKRSKELTQAVRAREIQAMGDTAPPALLNLAFRMMTSVFLEALPLPFNLIVSNVPGPPIPLFVAGAKLEAMYPLSLLQPGNGLNITVMSYLDHIDFGFTVDPELIPDPWYLAEGIPPALDELVAATSRPA
jgi:WS/DGAT/MGAT family acyltransferase